MIPDRPEELTRETVVVLGLDDPKALLARFALFRGLPDDVVGELATYLEWISLPGGARLFGVGDEADAAYLLVSGALAAIDDGRPVATRVNAGEAVGVMGLIAGTAHASTVAALRDCELVRIPRAAFEQVLLHRPDAVLRLARLAANRLEHVRAGESTESVPRTFTLLPASPLADVARFAADFVDALEQFGRVELVRSARGQDHSSQWFHNVEKRNDFVVYVGEAENSPWTRLCVRQADALVVLARSDDPPRPLPIPAEPGSISPPCELVLVHATGFVRGAAGRYRSLHPDLPVHHARNGADVARIARLLTGRAVGLVLSGGGARGFAHIGAVRALREHGVRIDLAGGTSMGALMSAGVALEWTHEELVERFRRSFVDSNPLADFTIPLVSLVSGRKVARLLQREFGDIGIEDMPIPYFCVSANLTTGRLAMHRQGPLWNWLRASIALPGVLPAVCSNGQVFVDGGAMNNLPVDLMRSLGRGPVIGVDASADIAFTAATESDEPPRAWHFRRWLRAMRGRPNILQILWRVGMINGAATIAAQRAQSDLLLRPPMQSLDLLDWRSFEQAIEIGYRHTLEALETAPASLQPHADRAGGSPSLAIAGA
jgi:NTE family protein